MNDHRLIIDWGPDELMCACGWKPRDDMVSADWQEHQWMQHIIEVITALFRG